MDLGINFEENLPAEVFLVALVMVALTMAGVLVGSLAFVMFDTSTKIFKGESRILMLLEALAVIPMGIAGYWGLHWLVENYAPAEIATITQKQIYTLGETLLFLVLPVAWGLGSAYRWRTRSRFNRGLDQYEH